MTDLQYSFNAYLIKNLYQNKIIKEHSGNINSMDYSSDGTKLLTSGDDDLIVEYNFLPKKNENVLKIVHSKIYGCVHALYTKNNDEIVFCGKFDYRIMIMSLKKENFVCNLFGHKGKITSMNVDRNYNYLLSTSNDYQTFLWNLTKKTCVRAFSFSLYATFDSRGEIICQAKLEETDSSPKESVIILYDKDTIAISTNELKKFPNIRGEVKEIKIPNSGEFIAALQNYRLYIIDCKTNKQKLIIALEPEPIYMLNVFDISPDCEFIVVGNEFGQVEFWNFQDKNSVMSKPYHITGCHAMKFNPVYMQIATASEVVILLEPNFEGKPIHSLI